MLDVEPASGGDEDDEQPQGSPKSLGTGEYLTNFSSPKPELFFNGDLRVRASPKWGYKYRSREHLQHP